MILYGTNPSPGRTNDDPTMRRAYQARRPVLDQTAEIGFDGIENGKPSFPKDSAALKGVLEPRGLSFVSRLDSDRPLADPSPKAQEKPHVRGAGRPPAGDRLRVMIACETSNTVHGLGHPAVEEARARCDAMDRVGAKVEQNRRMDRRAAACPWPTIRNGHRWCRRRRRSTGFMAARVPPRGSLFDSGHTLFRRRRFRWRPSRNTSGRLVHFHAKERPPPVMGGH